MKYYGKYKDELGSANTQQVLNKNNEAWSSFFSLLKLRKKGKLPPHMNHVSPPSYWKDEDGRKLLLAVREDNYVVDELNHKLILKYFKMEIGFTVYFYLQNRIGEVQSLSSKMKNINEYEAYYELNREKRRLFKKLTRRLLHLYRNFASHLLKALHELGVSTIYLGYPFNIAQDKGNKFTVNLWSYRELMNIIELKAQEYGIRVFEVIEYNTSKYLCLSRC